MHASFKNMNSSVGEEQDYIAVEEDMVKNEHQASVGKVAKGKRFECAGGSIQTEPKANKDSVSGLLEWNIQRDEKIKVLDSDKKESC